MIACFNNNFFKGVLGGWGNFTEQIGKHLYPVETHHICCFSLYHFHCLLIYIKIHTLQNSWCFSVSVQTIQGTNWNWSTVYEYFAFILNQPRKLVHWMHRLTALHLCLDFITCTVHVITTDCYYIQCLCADSWKKGVHKHVGGLSKQNVSL